jgi:deferrochelatase/peroxidase EfeB
MSDMLIISTDFGFMDGISQPAVNGFVSLTTLLPGQIRLDPGLFLLGETGDTLATSRPTWAKDGSFLAFRQLQQKVPEFDNFLTTNALNVPGLTPEENAELLGARMVGRWKSVST